MASGATDTLWRLPYWPKPIFTEPDLARAFEFETEARGLRLEATSVPDERVTPFQWNTPEGADSSTSVLSA